MPKTQAAQPKDGGLSRETADALHAYAQSEVAERALRRWIIDYWAIARTTEILRRYKATRSIPPIMITRWWFGERMTPRYVEAILRVMPLVERHRCRELFSKRAKKRAKKRA